MPKQIAVFHPTHSEKGTVNPAPLVIMAVVFALAGWAIVHFVVPLFRDKQIPAAGQVISPDEQAAIAGVSAFYTIDYTEPENAWADRVCAVSTDEGCTVVKGYLAAAIRLTAEKYSVQTGCTVLPVELVENDEINQLRIWKVQVTLANPWPGVEQTHAVYVAVEYDSTLQKWLMQHILFKQEMEKYTTTATP